MSSERKHFSCTLLFVTMAAPKQMPAFIFWREQNRKSGRCQPTLCAHAQPMQRNLRAEPRRHAVHLNCGITVFQMMLKQYASCSFTWHAKCLFSAQSCSCSTLIFYFHAQPTRVGQNRIWKGWSALLPFIFKYFKHNFQIQQKWLLGISQAGVYVQEQLIEKLVKCQCPQKKEDDRTRQDRSREKSGK